MAKKAKQPDPVGLAPLPGFEHPLYPTIGQKDVTPPQGGYRSQISTRSPIGDALLGRVASVKTPFRSGSGSSGDMSRSAFARSLMDTSSNAIKRSADKFNVEYRTQAEKSRADDILAQRQNSSDRMRLDTLRDVYYQDVLTGDEQKIKDLVAYQNREFANADSKFWSGVLGSL